MRSAWGHDVSPVFNETLSAPFRLLMTIMSSMLKQLLTLLCSSSVHAPQSHSNMMKGASTLLHKAGSHMPGRHSRGPSGEAPAPASTTLTATEHDTVDECRRLFDELMILLQKASMSSTAPSLDTKALLARKCVKFGTHMSAAFGAAYQGGAEQKYKQEIAEFERNLPSHHTFLKSLLQLLRGEATQGHEVPKESYAKLVGSADWEDGAW
jgi:hypothetical protein